MSATLEVALTAKVKDLAFAGSDATFVAKDASATTHEYVDQTPRTVSTPGAAGASFVTLETPVRQVERILADFASGTNVVIRLDGAVASVTGGATPPVLTDGWTAVLNVDGAGNVTTSFLAADNTMALVAKRINYAHGAQVASVDAVTGALVISGTKTGGDDARKKSFQYGSVVVVSGTALAALGLTAGTTYGSGEDHPHGAGGVQINRPSSSLPKRIELSGSASASRFAIAGKAS